jgi:hypothetical protein
MNEVFSYPMTQSELLLNHYATISWTLGMLALGTVWGIFFRYGNFKYGIDLGCLFKTALIIISTTLALGLPLMYNTKFFAQHGHEGDKLTLSNDALLYESRQGKQKTIKYAEIQRIYKEPVTFNPPKTYYIVALVDSLRVDSLGVKETLPNFDQFLQKLSEKSNRKIERAL